MGEKAGTGRQRCNLLFFVVDEEAVQWLGTKCVGARSNFTHRPLENSHESRT